MAIVPFFIIALCASRALAACSSIEIRKEWLSFNVDEQASWIDAVKCMAQLPHNDSLVATVGQFASIANITANSSYYDDYSYVHSDLNPIIHLTGLFFPWHRYYVWSYNQALKDRCGYTGVAPYWDWTIDTGDVANSPIFSTAIGPSTGDPNTDYSLPSGSFSSSSNFTLAYPIPHHLRRNFTLNPYVGLDAPEGFITNPNVDANATFTADIINALIANYTGDFKGFQKEMETFQGPHASVHSIVGGDFIGKCPKGSPDACFAPGPNPTFSPNEVLFWMHHGFVDKIWWQWQNAHPDNLYAFEGGSVQSLENITAYEQYPNGAPPMLSMESVLPSDGILMPDGLRLEDVWVTEGDVLCYTYE